MSHVQYIQKLFGLFIMVAALAVSGHVNAGAGIVIINADGPGEGFNDPTPAASVGGNPGITLGQQRLNAFQFAANIWSGLLNNRVRIEVEARFDPLSCGATWAVLGSAGTNTVHRDFPGAGFANTWYHQALANHLANIDLAPANRDMSATFNSSIGGAGCLTGMPWYLGYDGDIADIGNSIDLVAVLVHEIAHGVGFSTFVDETTGARFLSRNDIFMRKLHDHSTNKLWPSMTNTQRRLSAIDTGDLHWVGTNVVTTAPGHVRMYAPNPVEPGSSVSHFDSILTPNQLMEPFITDPPVHNPGLAVPLMYDLGW